ncbi:MAG: alpha/beta hydrolase [Variovorax sp.]|jgi:predicted alpha/beta-hydrolase family hydrolase|nr:alpha/beta hydrolase [Variovorax sp.]
MRAVYAAGMKRIIRLRIGTQSGAVDGIAMVPRQVEAAYVFAHGAGAGMSHPFMDAVADGLARRRIATLRFQFPYMQAGRRGVDAPAIAHETVRAAVGRANALWPSLPLFAGGKSFGGRMTSQAQANAPLPAVLGLAFLGFPLHPAGKPSVERAGHLALVDVPMLFIHGARDALAQATQFRRVTSRLGPLASVKEVADADHAFHVPRRTGLTDSEVLDEILDVMAVWTQAWRVRPSTVRGSAAAGSIGIRQGDRDRPPAARGSADRGSKGSRG